MWKDKIRISIGIGPEFHCLGGEDNNSNNYRNRARITMFESIISAGLEIATDTVAFAT